MAVVLVNNGAYIGALAGMMAGRGFVSASKTDAEYVAICAAAAAFKAEFNTLNNASAVPLADATGSVDVLVAGCCQAIFETKYTKSATAADYATLAGAALALAQAGIANIT